MADTGGRVNRLARLVMGLVFVVLVGVGSVGEVKAACLGQVYCRPWNPVSKTCAGEGYANTGCGAGQTENACNSTWDFSKSCGDASCYIIDTCW